MKENMLEYVIIFIVGISALWATIYLSIKSLKKKDSCQGCSYAKQCNYLNKKK